MIWVPGGYGRPYKASLDVYGREASKSTKFYYIRKVSSTLKASPEEYPLITTSSECKRDVLLLQQERTIHKHINVFENLIILSLHITSEMNCSHLGHAASGL